MTKILEIEAIARQAGAAIMEVYNSADSLAVQYKDDDSPLTEADRRANAIIEAGLAELEPRLPILSEESAQPGYETRRQWQRYWLVDPLDGTREFVKRNGEFTVNIALVGDSVAELGVVHVPVSGVSYMGAIGHGAFRQDTGSEPIPISAGAKLDNAPLKVMASRSHLDQHVKRVLRRLEVEYGAVETVNMGSSLKICLLAEGKADIYPRLAPTSEWDTAAAHAVLAAAGGEISNTAFQPLRYNQKEDLRNPHFIAVADPTADWRAILASVLPVD
ncbi:MAG: 3'(2'),5'-bisphosphate nucleotidase CysQ [Gammaproteobacteria bacterium]|nr:3'(2'),5'-bisphosphate nucleotidase CysQ [Gammaproteobacteria bacterium]